MSFVIPGVIGMATGAFLFMKPKRGLQAKGADGKPGLMIQAPVTTEEIHHDRVMVTDQPVETGSPISDHSFPLPAEVTITMIWSDSPPPMIGGVLGAGLGAVFGNIAGGVLAGVLTGTAIARSVLVTSQSKEAYTALIDAKNRREIFDVLTGKRDYRNMLITDVRLETSPTSEYVASVRVSLREVLFATARTYSASGSGNPAQDAASQKEEGKPASSGNVLESMKERVSGVLNNGMQQAKAVLTDVQGKVQDVLAKAESLGEEILNG